VKAVLEVKATSTIKHAKKVVGKLLKLQHFREPASKEPWDRALPKDFFTAAVLFETKVEDAKEFSKAIDALSPLWESTPGMPTAGALILRGQTHPTKSAVIGTQVGRDVPPDDESVLYGVQLKCAFSPSGASQILRNSHRDSARKSWTPY